MDIIKKSDISKPKVITEFQSCPCYRCGGSGIYSQFHGECYTCGGSGVSYEKVKIFACPSDWSQEECEQALAKKEAADEKRRKAAEIRKRAKLKVQSFEAIEFLKQNGVYDGVNLFMDLDGFRDSDQVFPSERFGYDSQEDSHDLSFLRQVEINNSRIISDIMIQLRDKGSISSKQIELIHKVTSTVLKVRKMDEERKEVSRIFLTS